MRWLALDTSSPYCSVAFLDTAFPEIIHQEATTTPLQHGRFILPLIESLLRAGSTTVADLDGVIYSAGPGALTGVRLACAVAQGLGLAAHCPVIPVSSLAVLAEMAQWVHGETHCLVATDAHGDAVYWGVFSVNQDGELTLQGSERRAQPEALPPVAPDVSWCGVGEGWRKYAPRLIGRLGFAPRALYTELSPKANILLTLGQRAYQRGFAVQAADAVPTYLG